MDGWIRERYDGLLPEENYKEFNLGVLDMGALVCKQTHPVCEDCPISEGCEYQKKDD